MEHAIDIRITLDKWVAMTPEERGKFVEMILDSMTDEQKIQMALIGKRVIEDDIRHRATGRSRTALRTMARAVNVTVNEFKER